MSPRGYLVPSRRWFPLDGRLHKAWWHWTDASLPIWPYSLPLGPWRWLCWLNRGHVDDLYGCCVHCGKPLPGSHRGTDE